MQEKPEEEEEEGDFPKDLRMISMEVEEEESYL